LSWIEAHNVITFTGLIHTSSGNKIASLLGFPNGNHLEMLEAAET
jgi:hypothetical protein